MPIEPSVRFLNLRNAPTALWFTLTPGDPDPKKVAMFESMWAAESGWTSCWIAHTPNEPRIRARTGGWIKPTGAFRLWSMRWVEDADSAERDALADGLLRVAIEQASARAKEVGDIAFLEACPAHDVEDPERARAALSRAGFDEVSAAHTYTVNGDAIPEFEPSVPDGIAIVHSLDPSDISVDLLRRGQSGTLDRVDASPWVSEEATHQDLCSMAPQGPCWIARAGDESVGYVWVMEEVDGDAWIIDIGVVPEHRGKGLAGALIRAALGTLRARRTIYALIDSENAPSIKLHTRQGFVQNSGPFWTYRRGV